jgi:hypothetical protein
MTAVDRVLIALNAHDLDTFIACYAEDATIEDGYDRVVARGHDGLRERYGPMFEQHPDVEVRPLLRVEEGEFVIQHEEVTGRGELMRHVAVYLVRDDHIVRERLIG